MPECPETGFRTRVLVESTACSGCPGAYPAEIKFVSPPDVGYAVPGSAGSRKPRMLYVVTKGAVLALGACSL
jgi:hypothetical protein